MVPTLDIGQAFKAFTSKMMDMNSRSRRSEFWWIMLFAGIGNMIFAWIPYVGPILAAAIFVCTAPLMVRRLHDTNKGALLVWVFLGIYVAAQLFSQIGEFCPRPSYNFWTGESSGGAYTVMKTISWILIIPAWIIEIILIVFWCQDSNPQANEWGVSPKYPDGVGPQQQYGPQQFQQPYQQYGPQQPQQGQYQQPQQYGPQQPQQYGPQQGQYQQPQQPQQYGPQQPR
ncbi:MAG: DUF805 domain-containing protein [Prevotella sp.]|nr:DUF805 domain-containing protein [Prevotella sp.]